MACRIKLPFRRSSLTFKRINSLLSRLRRREKSERHKIKATLSNCDINFEEFCKADDKTQRVVSCNTPRKINFISRRPLMTSLVCLHVFFMYIYLTYRYMDILNETCSFRYSHLNGLVNSK